MNAKYRLLINNNQEKDEELLLKSKKNSIIVQNKPLNGNNLYFCCLITHKNQRMQQARTGFLGGIPTVCKNILIINIIVWLAQMVLMQRGIDLSDHLGLYYFESPNFRIYQFITYMFLHDPHSFTHVFFNMFAVFMFGRLLEQIWGPKRFLIYYFITGLGAALIQMLVVGIRIHSVKSGLSSDAIYEVYEQGRQLLDQNMNYTDAVKGSLNLLINTGTIGASGAVFGILLAFGMLFPNIPLYIIPFPFPIKAKWLVILYGLSELFFGLAYLQGDNVAHFAHLGGMFFGIFVILYWKKKDKKENKDVGYFR